MSTAEAQASAIKNPKHIWWDLNRVVVYTDGDIPKPEKACVATAYQIRKALNQAGLRDSVEAHVKTMDKDVQDAWRYASNLERYSPVLINSAALIGLTDTQLDDLFELAANFQD